MMRIFGLDIGKVSFGAVWFEKLNGQWQVKDTFWQVHQQEIGKIWEELKRKWRIREEDRVVVTGRLHQDRFRKTLLFPHIPEKVAQQEAAKHLYPDKELTIIRLGGGGFSVLSRDYHENPRCAAGTGSFLDQIIGPGQRFEFENISQADQAAKDAQSLEMTRRCGVTMKSEATHLANDGAPRERIVAGLLDSLAKNALTLAQQTKIAPRVLVIGGLSVSERIVKKIQESLSKEKKVKVEVPKEAFYFEALGAALIGKRVVEENLVLPRAPVRESPLVYLPGLRKHQHLVFKMEAPEYQEPRLSDPLILGFDIGSTGSKLVIFNQEPVLERYTETKGQPVEAARELLVKVPQRYLNQIRAIGLTGSGRYTVGGVLKASLSAKERERIVILNEIAAHLAGAHWYDLLVDSIMDLGGQDVKFIRSELGRMIDFCMNTVCSAGTGSFLAEQADLLGIKDVVELGRIALESSRAVDLGQHCAVFMSEQIDEARRKGAKLQEIVAGLYYSIIRNYDNRVKGSKQWGKRIYLQGKPAENLALACALAGVTGNKVIVPPSPGIPGALGIAILTQKEMAKMGKNLVEEEPLDLRPFLEIPILGRREFRCPSKKGCKIGARCPIKEIRVEISGKETIFRYGGACDLYEKRPGRNPELARGPHAFAERENLILGFLKQGPGARASSVRARSVAVPRGLEVEEVLPLVITFLQELDFEVKLQEKLSLKHVEEGAKLCQATFCAPLQLLAGQAKLEEDVDFVFLPKIIEISGIVEEPERQRCFTCPLSQAMPDLFSPKLPNKVLQPFLDFKQGYEKNREEFLKIGAELGSSRKATSLAFDKAVKAQQEFEISCRRIGERALEFAKEKEIPAVVVLGHPYIVHSALLTAGIPQAIEENGAIAIPADCYPLSGQNSLPKNIYWGYGQRLLQAAFEIRRQPGVYPLWLSVYSCGPDSFLVHFFQYLSQGKPYTILESDAYTGQAGFTTRVEAFLYGVKNYQPKKEEILPDLQHFDYHESLAQIKESGRTVLVPWMGEGAIALAALFRSMGIKSQALPLGDRESLGLGRKHTSGKECLPMIDTLGSLRKYLEEKWKINPDENFYYFMPQASGPCRFGQYQLLFKIILEKMGLAEKVKVISPTSETGYQYQLELGPAIMAKAWRAIVFVDLLKDALLDIRPEEQRPGETQKVFDYYLQQAERTIENGNVQSLVVLAKRAAQAFQRIPRDSKKQEKPTVLVTGEIYVRLNNFANNFVIRALENLGCKVKLAPTREWFNYISYLRKKRLTLLKTSRVKTHLTYWRQQKIEKNLYQIFAKALGWSNDHHIEEILKTAEPYLSELKPLGEAGLTIGLPLLLWKKKEIDGAVIVGPFECMPSRIAETQLNLISQQTGLPVLNLSFYGEPSDPEVLESFIWDLRE